VQSGNDEHTLKEPDDLKPADQMDQMWENGHENIDIKSENPQRIVYTLANSVDDRAQSEIAEDDLNLVDYDF
jgi:hypothetical protein